MKMTSAGLTIGLIAVGGATFLLWRGATAERQQDVDASTELAGAPPASLATTPDSTAAMPSSAAATAPTSSIAESTPRPEAGVSVPDAATMRALISSPEAVARGQLFRRNRVEAAHPYVSEALGLTPEESQELLALLATHQANRSAISGGNLEQRTTARRALLQANDAELRNLLGSKHPLWQDYQAALPAWQQVRDLSAVAAAEDDPLTDAQIRALGAALAVEQQTFNQQRFDALRQRGHSVDAMTQHTPERHQRLLDTAAAHLTTQQHEAYRAMLGRAALQEQFSLSAVRAAQLEDSGSAPR